MATFKKTASGKWEAQVYKHGARRTKTLKTKALAQRWAAQTETELEVTSVSGKVETKGDYRRLLQDYSAAEGKNFSRSRGQLVAYATSIYGKLDMQKATQLSVVAAFDRSPLAASTKAQALRILAGAVSYAARHWTWDVSPEPLQAALAALTAAGKVSKPNKRDRRVSSAELDLLEADWTSPVDFDVYRFLVALPLRSGELCALRWEDVDERIITVRNRKGTKRDDRVPLIGASAEIMEKWKAAQSTPTVIPWSQQTLSKKFGHAGKAAGLGDLRLHDLRHEGISRLFDAGWTIPQVQIVSGHARWETLQRYTHVKADDLLNLPI